MADGRTQQDDWVLRVLGIAVGSKAAPVQDPAAGAAVRLAKGLLLWNSTRSHVASQVTKLQQAIIGTMQGDPEIDDIIANIGNLEAVLEHLDDSLSDKLGELRGATDPDEKNKLSAEARRIVQNMQKYVAADPLMAGIDDNGFVALDIKPHVETTLSAILQTI